MKLQMLPSACGTAAQTATLFQLVNHLCAQMPAQVLHPSERRHLGGLIQPFTSALVTLTTSDMCQRPELFANSPVTGQELKERQSCANGWLIMRNFFKLLMERANDNYLLTQGQLANDTLAVLRSTSELPRTDPQRLPRMLALIGAYAFVDRYHKAIQKKKKARQKARAGADAPPKKPRRGLRGDARKATLQRYKALFLEVFEEWRPATSPQCPPPQGPPSPPSTAVPNTPALNLPPDVISRLTAQHYPAMANVFGPRQQGLEQDPDRIEASLTSTGGSS